MKENDNLPNIIAGIAVLLFIGFVLVISRPKHDEPLQGGNIQHAIETGQYR